MENQLNQKSYVELIENLKKQINLARIKANLAINKEMVLHYWHIAKKILERQNRIGWGTKLIENLSKDRAEFSEMKSLPVRILVNIQIFAKNFAYL